MIILLFYSGKMRFEFGREIREEKDIEFNKLLEFLSMFKKNKSESYLIFSQQKRELMNKIEEIVEKIDKYGIVPQEVLGLADEDPYFYTLQGKNEEEIRKVLNKYLQERLMNRILKEE